VGERALDPITASIRCALFDLSMKRRLEQLASKWHEMAERAERSER
jgi:hypothetical protein